MSETNCDQNCDACGVDCEDRREPQSFQVKPHELSNVKHVIAIVSGKGGVGKSLVTALSAVTMSRMGRSVGILDADITGPSIPKLFGVSGALRGSESGAYPLVSDGGIQIMSMNLLLQNSTDPVIWRGPIIAGIVKQFWQEIIWEDVDYLFVDMPPGTGDVPLTVFQSLPVDGILVVTSPQDLALMIVEKAVNMAKMMNIPILGLLENMASFRCPDCGKEHRIFGESHLPAVAAKYDLPVLGHIPIDPKLAVACDTGAIETYEGHWLDDAAKALTALDQKQA
ncbi:MAG: Mrp/NBP35 family ATP-binding protein [Schwartzia sp.]|nr:Mrp/NBP35 family ATP-binding protein [Schwartzia sp. (in: firmicutes)]MBR1884951.1 Mrp/NBP35 family ATP-binding protein [Schwartzia sp. (in: firmicutes)]